MTDHHEHGFATDLPKLLSRRKALTFGAGAFVLLSTRAFAETTGTSADGVMCIAHPEETAGPFPGDGTNKARGELINVLTQEGVIREDITKSFAGMTPTAEGVPLMLELTIIDVNNGCKPLVGYAVYLWHCDAIGQYSLYSTSDSNYLRGVGISDENGKIKFTTIIPGCYDGRTPHMHYEVYENIESATSGKAAILTSQLTIATTQAADIYAQAPLYTASIANLERSPLKDDMVFSDNSEGEIMHQTIQMTGNVSLGFAGGVGVNLTL